MGIKLEKKVFVTGTIEVKTGLSVGGSSVGLEIGGADKVVIRNPITNQPYIPGSSLKGKMRSLLEKLDGKLTYDKGNAMPCKCGECLICRVFGVPAEEKGTPTRLIVRDSDLIGIMKNGEFKKGAEQLEKAKNTDMPYTEIKTEVVIDRISSAATPRQFERVPAGAVFSLNLVCNIYEGDNEKDIINKVFEGLKLVQDDYLGGSGTRGYGEVKFKIEESLKYCDKDSYEKNTGEKNLTGIINVPQELK